MRRYGIAAIALTVLLMLPACSGEGEGGKTGREAGSAGVAAGDSVAAEDIGMSLVYAEEALWTASCGRKMDRPSERWLSTYDTLFVITNSNNEDPQYPVAEIGPPREDYDGRWRTFTARWTEEGFMAHETVPLLQSYGDVITHAGLGHIEINEGPPADGPPGYFSCKLKPWQPEQD